MNKKMIKKVAGAALVSSFAVAGGLWYAGTQLGGSVAGPSATQATPAPVAVKQMKAQCNKAEGITTHYKWKGSQPHVYYKTANQKSKMSYPGVPMKDEGNGWYSYTIAEADSADMVISVPELEYETTEFSREKGEYWYSDEQGWSKTQPEIYEAPKEAGLQKSLVRVILAKISQMIQNQLRHLDLTVHRLQVKDQTLETRPFTSL